MPHVTCTCDLPQVKRVADDIGRAHASEPAAPAPRQASQVDFLLALGYPLKRTDNRSIAEAVSAYLADSVMEGA